MFVADDWAEDHHDVEVQNESGRRLAKARLLEGVAGMASVHVLLGDHLDLDGDGDQVAVGIETDRGLGRQAFTALTASPAARAHHDQLHDRGKDHNAALRQLANRLVGILHGRLKTNTSYDELTAWRAPHDDVA